MLRYKKRKYKRRSTGKQEVVQGHFSSTRNHKPTTLSNKISWLCLLNMAMNERLKLHHTKFKFTCDLVWQAAFGRSPPVVTTAFPGHVECKRLISTNAIDWSVTMQMDGQVHAITQAHIKNRQTTTRPWKATGLQGLPALSIGATAPPKYG